jgi:hypothetical protein
MKQILRCYVFAFLQKINGLQNVIITFNNNGEENHKPNMPYDYVAKT